MSVLFRQEQLNKTTCSGRSKILGTVIAISGAMIICLYKGYFIDLVPRSFSSSHSTQLKKLYTETPQKNEALGIAVTLIACICSSSSLIVDDKLLQKYPNALRAAGIKVAFAAVQCTAFALLMDRKLDRWRINIAIPGAAIVYTAVVSSGIMLVLTSWCVAKKGPIVVAAFSPITLIVVTLASPFFLSHQSLHSGSIIGAAVIMGGVYLIVWGKKDDNKVDQPTEIDHLSSSISLMPVEDSSSPTSVPLSFPSTPAADVPSPMSIVLSVSSTPPADSVVAQPAKKEARVSFDSYFSADGTKRQMQPVKYPRTV